MQQQHSLHHNRAAAAGLRDDHMRHVLARCSLLGSQLHRTTCAQHPIMHSRQHRLAAAAAATADAPHATAARTGSSSRTSAARRTAQQQQQHLPSKPKTTAAAQDKAAGAARNRSSGKSLMIVESPTKANKIQKFLGEDYQVVASYGHVRDLLNKAGAVDPAADFNLVWAVTGAAGESRLKEIAAAASGCRSVLLATDPDREGEAISWHLTQELQRRGVLRPGQDLQRVTFTEVTQKAVKEALQHPRQVSDDLVNAYLARRALDYLLGFGLSPLLWRRLGPAARSAGRVQSVALRLVCEREDAVQLFVPDEYWSIEAAFDPNTSSSSSNASNTSSTAAAANGGGAAGGAAGTLPAKLVVVDGQKLSQLAIKTQQQAEELVRRLWQQQEQQQQQPSLPSPLHQQGHQNPAAAVFYTVHSVVKRPVKRNPPPPLVTSTLQQEAARRLGFSASKTMQVAQQLYEGANTGEGLITYMRTDGVSLSTEAVQSLRDTISQAYGPDHLPATGPRVYKSRAKNAQEAHEAIRPTNPALRPGDISGLTADQANLYSLVWRRAMASQMESAELQQVSVEFISPCSSLLLRCTGSSLSSPGWLAAWADWSKAAAAAAGDDGADGADDDRLTATAGGSDLASTDDDDDAVDLVAASAGGSGSRGGASSSTAALSQLLQQLQEGQQVLLAGVSSDQHFTKPPARYTEASMVKTLEEAGVGRPSTYAPIIRKLLERGYVVKSGRTLVPTPLGRLLTAYLTIHFTEYVDVNFTAKVEEQLDDVSAGALAWKKLMREFWGPLEQAMSAAQAVSTTQVFDQLQQQLDHLIFMPPRLAPAAAAAAGHADTGADSSQGTLQAADTSGSNSQPLIDHKRCPVCGGQLVLKPSRSAGGFIGCSNYESQGCTFGRPLWPDLEEAASLSDEEEAVAAAAAGGGMLGAVKVLGHQPGTELPVLLKRGPFGLYVQLGDDFSALGADSSSSNGNTAGPKVAGKKKGSSKVSRATLPRSLNWSNTTLQDALQLLALPRTLGDHPEDGEPVVTNSGRFGPYVQHRTLYAPLPKGSTPQEVTFEEAVELLTAKAARMRARGRDPYMEKPKNGKKAASKQGSSKVRSKASKSSSAGQLTDNDDSSSRVVSRMTGYNLFMREQRASIAASAAAAQGNSSSSSSSTAGSSSVLSLIAAAWRELPEDQRAAYNLRACQQNEATAGGEPGAGQAGSTGAARARSSSSKTRSQQHTASGASTSSSRSRSRTTQRPEPGSTEPGDAAGGVAGTSSGARATSSRSRSRPASAGRLSPYQLFCQQQRPSLLAANPGLKPQEVFSRLGAAWKDLSEDGKAAYSSMSSSSSSLQQEPPPAELPVNPISSSSNGTSSNGSGGSSCARDLLPDLEGSSSMAQPSGSNSSRRRSRKSSRATFLASV